MKQKIVASGAIVALVLCLGGEARAQLPEPKRTGDFTKQAPAERQGVYEGYFKKNCEGANRCDRGCKDLFDKIEHKERLRLQCR